MGSFSILGQVLLWTGFLSGSLATVFSLEKTADPWSTINWWWYGVSAIVCMLGVAMLRASKKIDVSISKESTDGFASLPKTMTRVIASVNELRNIQDTIKPSEIVHFIDERLADDLRQFADARESVISHKGLSEYADVMTQFAAGERAINRAWSAAADGYVDEVALCLERAEAFFQNTRELLQ